MSAGAGGGDLFDIEDDAFEPARPRRDVGRGGARRRPPARGGRGARRRRRQRSDLGGRVIVAIPAVIAVLVVNGIGGAVWALALLGIGVLSLHELYAMLRPVRPIALAGFLGLAGLLAAALWGTHFHILLAAVAVVPVLFALTALGGPRSHATLAMGATLLGVYWVGFALAHAVLLRELPHGDAIVIDVLVGTFVGDTAAYFGGRMFGRRKLAPRISPNKTVEGLVIGMVAAVAGVVLASLYQDWLPVTHALAIGAGVAIAGPIGDLFESFIKRDVGTKDTGRAFGAHGGALDRIDAALFAAVVGYYIWHGLA